MRVCRNCRKRFQPTFNTLQPCCGLDCARAWAQTERGAKFAEAERRKENKADKARIKTLQMLKDELQTSVNRWVRFRDSGLPCVSCGHPDDGSRQRHASHFRPAGSNPALRFEPDNIHASCARCNSHLSGNLIPYRAELIRRRGLDRVKWLESSHPLPKWNREDLRRMATEFRELAKANKSRLDDAF